MRKPKKKYQIVRTYSAGVFAGFVESRVKDEVIMTDAQRLWYWAGASSLSQLAMEGVKNPKGCKFPGPVDRVTLLGVIEILDCTKMAQGSIQAVPIWKRKDDLAELIVECRWNRTAARNSQQRRHRGRGKNSSRKQESNPSAD